VKLKEFILPETGDLPCTTIGFTALINQMYVASVTEFPGSCHIAITIYHILCDFLLI